MPALVHRWRARGGRRGADGWHLLPWGFVVSIMAWAGGCHLPSRDGPVPRSLADCRQLSQRGVSAEEREDWASAETLFGQAVHACAVDPEARRHYAEALWHQNQRQKALEQLDEAIRLAGDDDRLYVRAAEMRLEMGDVQGASKQAGVAIDLNPQSAAAWALQGQILVRTRRPREALAAYYRALGCSPENREVLLALAETYRAMNEPQRALLKLHNLIDTYPAGEEPQNVLHLQGLALAALGRHADAAAVLLVARDRGPPNSEILYHLAEAEAQAGQLVAARRTAEQVLALDPRHQAARTMLDKLSIAQGRPQAAGFR